MKLFIDDLTNNQDMMLLASAEAGGYAHQPVKIHTINHKGTKAYITIIMITTNRNDRP